MSTPTPSHPSPPVTDESDHAPTLRLVRKRVSATTTQRWTFLSPRALKEVNRTLDALVQPSVLEGTGGRIAKRTPKQLSTATSAVEPLVGQLKAVLSRTPLPLPTPMGSSEASITQHFDLDLSTRRHQQLGSIYTADLKQVTQLEKELMVETLALKSDEVYYQRLLRTMEVTQKEMAERLGVDLVVGDLEVNTTEAELIGLRCGGQALLMDEDVREVTNRVVKALEPLEALMRGLDEVDSRLDCIEGWLELC